MQRGVVSARVPERQPPADRAAGAGIRQEPAGERLRNDGHHFGARGVVHGESAPAQQRDSHRVEIPVADPCDVRIDPGWRNVRLRPQRYRSGAVPEVHRQTVGYRDG
jgi:hypothetical protein